MQLKELLEVLPGCDVSGPTEIEIASLAYDSRRVKPGGLFVAIRGLVHDGRQFVPDALSRGARVIVAEADVPVPSGVTLVRTADSREALALLSAQFYGWPARHLRMIGVTGTNGKTTTTNLIRRLLQAAGHRVGLIGTINNFVGEEIRPVDRTTPESLDLQELLHQMVQAGCSHAVMEVSSHALELKRVLGCKYDVAVFTNLTQDHLDFHKTLELYRNAKARLFENLGREIGVGPRLYSPGGTGQVAVINADDPSGRIMAERTAARVITYGVDRPADLRASSIQVGSQGVSYDLATPAGEAHFKLRLTGRFNVYNSMAAVAVALSEGVDLKTIQTTLEAISGVAGRFEAVDLGQDFGVFVDYAHTPDGLENILETAKEFAKGRVLLVFGAGGDRDRTKRPIMGELAARYADFSIVTSDNPRSEDPGAILKDIEAGVRRVTEDQGRYRLEPDREKAIEEAIMMARKDDVVLIAGKGHETCQIFRDRTIHFDDREVAGEKLRVRLGRG
jgi:UDP-N-acetylmuramoyl-L-alanyl-D-glutamate--2,6-diaminopimelate ligase